MTNLLKETIEVLKEHGKTLKDIEWIGSEDGYITLETFKKLADTYYDAGYGAAEVAQDLLIVGKDFYMTRGEYDGSEWWNYHSMDLFKKPDNELKVIRLTSGMWNTLKDMQYEDKYYYWND